MKPKPIMALGYERRGYQRQGPAFILYAPGKVSKYHGPFYTVTEAELYAEGKLQYKAKEYEVHLLVQP